MTGKAAAFFAVFVIFYRQLLNDSGTCRFLLRFVALQYLLIAMFQTGRPRTKAGFWKAFRGPI